MEFLLALWIGVVIGYCLSKWIFSELIYSLETSLKTKNDYIRALENYNKLLLGDKAWK